VRTPFTELVGVAHPIVGFNRSPAVVAAVTNAGGLGVLAASAFTAPELDAQLTWIEEQVDGKPYGVDLLVPEKFATGDPDNLVASLRAQIPQAHLDFVAELLNRYGIPEAAVPAGVGALYDEIAAALSPAGAEPLLDVAFSHRIALIANALGTPPAGLVARAKDAGVKVAALVGQAKHARRQLDAGVDLLIHDSQFVAGEQAVADLFGHATIDDAIALAKQCAARRLALFHHGPARTDDDVEAIGRAASGQGVEVIVAREKAVIELGGGSP